MLLLPLPSYPAIMRLVRIERHPYGPRLFVLQRRTHHGAVGVALTVLGVALNRRLPSAILAAAGLALALHDRGDFRLWFTYERGA